MSAAKQTGVLIVGAGPAGMMSALCLARLGVPTLIVERQAGVNEHPKAHELNTRSIEILNELGVTTEELAVEASPDSDGSRILFCRTINEEFGRIDLLADGSSADKYAQHFRSSKPYLNLSQTELERVMLRHVRAKTAIELLQRHQWESVEQSDAGVTSSVRNLSDGKTLEIGSRYLLGADGAASRVRKALGIDMVGPEKLEDFINVYFEQGLRDYVETPAKLYWILHPEGYGAFIAHHVDKRWTYNFPMASPHESAEDFTEDVLTRRIQTALGTSRGIAIKSVSTWRMTVQIAERYRQGRVFLVGDSAHRFPPTGGLGMNTGIADAHNLCWKIAAVLHGNAPATLLESYETERKPVAERNAAESRTNYHKIFEVVEAFGLRRDGPQMLARVANSRLLEALPAFIRGAVLWLLRLPAHVLLWRFRFSRRVRARVATAIADQTGHFDRIGLDIGYVYEKGAVAREPDDDVPFEHQVTEYDPSTRPGARFPHVALEGDPDGSSSHDLIAYDRFTLLLGSDGESWREGVRSLETLRTRVHALSIHDAGTSADARAQLQSVCQIGDHGALLLRPDGHVAWRQRRRPNDPARTLKDIAAKVGLG